MGSLLLVACGDGNAEHAEGETVSEGMDTGEETETTEAAENDARNEEVEDYGEDQENLAIGDTARFDTDLTTYEITLENARIFDEIDGVASQLEKFLLVDLTIKNTGEETQSTEDLLYGLEVTEYLDGSRYGIFYYSYDTTEEIKMELEPGEETFGQFVAETYEGENYYLRTRVGLAASGYNDQIAWVIPEEEAEQE